LFGYIVACQNGRQRIIALPQNAFEQALFSNELGRSKAMLITPVRFPLRSASA
jgi:hypothetical protein